MYRIVCYQEWGQPGYNMYPIIEYLDTAEEAFEYIQKVLGPPDSGEQYFVIAEDRRLHGEHLRKKHTPLTETD